MILTIDLAKIMLALYLARDPFYGSHPVPAKFLLLY